MNEKFNDNILIAMEAAKEAVKVCKQAMIDANDESCRAMYSAIQKDCEKHIKMLKEEIELHKVQKKWEEQMRILIVEDEKKVAAFIKKGFSFF